MKRINTFLYDEIGNEYERKNQYLQELATLYDAYEVNKDQEIGRAIKSHKKKKKSHPYYEALSVYHEQEKLFHKDLRIQKKKYINDLPKGTPRQLGHLKVTLFLSKKRNKFYKAFQDLCYDAKYEYEKSLIEIRQLPDMIEHLEENMHDLEKARRITIDKQEEAKAKEAYTTYIIQEKAKLAENIKRLKDKRKDRLISKKALEDGQKELKLQYQEGILVKSYELPKKKNKEYIKNKKYEITHHGKRKRHVLNANIADLRRKTPVEIERSLPIHGWLSFMLPGLGQLLNKQYAKAALFFLITIFVYAIAIPYALGFGNYQGDGIGGLVSLAQNGSKLDKSLIFLIEGIIAIVLVVIAAIALYVSLVDTYRVDRDKIKGIRPKNWFETRTSVLKDGFPYMVSLPALIVTLFIVIVPIMTAILLSFTGMDPKHQSKFGWVGFGNYRLIALGQGIAGKVFWLILGWTVVWTIAASTLAIVLGFFLAILVNNERIRGKAFFRAVYLLPWAVPAFITVMFFSIMFSPNGALTEIISGIVGQHIVVKNDANLSRMTLILIQTWLGSSYIFLLSTGVLQGISSDLYEAAQIDGATPWQKLCKITLPIVLFQTAPLLVGQYTFNFNNFSTVYLFNVGGPFNPTKYGNLAGSTDLLISYIYKLTTDKQYQAIGAAITVVISMGLMLFAFIGFKNSKAFREEKL